MSASDYHLTSPQTFESAFNLARQVPQIAEATSTFEDKPGTRYFLTGGDASGFAVRANGELVYVFSVFKGRGDDIVDCAVTNGARHLDCFDGYLTELYARNGFVVSHREPNWAAGGPDVVYMRFD